MLVGGAGMVFTVTAREDEVLTPHSVDALTETLPLVVPTVAVIELVVEVPVHPFGKVHSYKGASGNGVIE
jgi:hypothetical protein